MAMIGIYDLTPRAGVAPIDWFRRHVADNGDRVQVSGAPRTLEALALFAAAFPSANDFASVIVDREVTGAPAEFERLVREVPRLAYAHVGVARADRRVPWGDVKLRKRKVILETENLQAQLERGYLFAWLSFTDLPSMRGEGEARWAAWRDREEARYLRRGLGQLGVHGGADDGLPAVADWRQVVTQQFAEGRAAARELPPGLLLARPTGGGAGYLFPGTSALTLAIPLAGADVRAVAEGFLRVPTLAHTLRLEAGGTVRQLVDGARSWPAPTRIGAPYSELLPSTAVGVPLGYQGELRFHAGGIGPSGGEVDVSLRIAEDGAERLSLSARWGLDDGQLRKLEERLGATLTFSLAA